VLLQLGVIIAADFGKYLKKANLSSGKRMLSHLDLTSSESFMFNRAPSMSTDCVRFISQSDFISGGSDGSLEVCME
jgi:hypothetical protein